MVSILLASVGEIVTKILLLTAFFTAIVTERTEQPALGILAGTGIRTVIELVHDIIATKLKRDQIVDTIEVKHLHSECGKVRDIRHPGCVGSE